MAVLDGNLIFTTITGQAITSATTTNSTDTIDFAPLSAPFGGPGAVNTIRDVGIGDYQYLWAVLTTGSVTTVTSPTIRFDVQTADDTAFSTNASVQMTSIAVPLPITTALAAAGQILLVARLPSAAFRRYNRLQMVTGGTITTASYTVVAGLAFSFDQMRYYTDAITIQ